MMNQILQSVSNQQLDWTALFNYSPAYDNVDHTDSNTTLSHASDNDDDTACKATHSPAPAPGNADDICNATNLEANMDLGTLCNICFYHQALDAEGLRRHEISNDNTLPYLCEWPGCCISTTNEETLDLHIQQYHELETWVYPNRECHRRFITQGDATLYITQSHPSSEQQHPDYLSECYRSYMTCCKSKGCCRICLKSSRTRSSAKFESKVLCRILLYHCQIILR